MRHVVWDEPGPHGNIHNVITEQEAIERSHEYAYVIGRSYPNHEEALDDFMTRHWAWFEETT